MDRRERILHNITKEQRGIEIAPWFAPIAPKREGYNCLALDVFDKPALLTRAKNDPNIPREGIALIEDVDFVGSATEIVDLVSAKDHGKFDYIISSHNFEHLPNPIRFLQGCQKVLKPDGVLAMAVPDCRACFDFFRPHTTLSDWLEAFVEGRTRPNSRQIFASAANTAVLGHSANDATWFTLSDKARLVFCNGDLAVAYEAWRDPARSTEYTDAHCTVMSPTSFHLLIYECQYLGLLSFDIENISETSGCEFYARLINRPEAQNAQPSVGEFNRLRTKLMQDIWNERAQASVWGQKQLSARLRLQALERSRSGLFKALLKAIWSKLS